MPLNEAHVGLTYANTVRCSSAEARRCNFLIKGASIFFHFFFFTSYSKYICSHSFFSLRWYLTGDQIATARSDERPEEVGDVRVEET